MTTQGTWLYTLRKQFEAEQFAYAQAEIRLAKQIQRLYPARTWTDCIKEASLIIQRHGINVGIVEKAA